MRYLSLFLLAFTFSSFAQKPLPVTDDRVDEPLEQTLSREGLNVSKQIVSYSASSTAALGTGFTLGNADVDNTYAPPGYGIWVRNAYVMSNVAVSVRLQLKPGLSALSSDFGTTSGVSILDVNPIYIQKNQRVTIPIYSDLLIGSRFTVTLVDKLDSTDNSRLRFRATIDGYETAYNRDKTAPKSILVIGTSISRGTGATYSNPYNAWPQIVKNYFVITGQRCKLVNKSVSGGTSTMMANGFDLDFQDVNNVSLVIIEHGMNDVSTGFNAAQQATYRANLKKAVDKCLGRYSSAKIILDGTSPAENNTREANLVIARGIASDLAASYSTTYPNRVLFVDTGNAFDRTVTTNFASTDTPGDRLHPSDIGHAAKAKVYTDYFRAVKFKLPNPKAVTN